MDFSHFRERFYLSQTAYDLSPQRPDEIEASAYAEFRAGLLKHIAMEEKSCCPLHNVCAAVSRFP
jgi:hypothetical protein